MSTINIDFKKTAGKIKPLHGVCCAPYSFFDGKEQTHIDKYFKEGSIPYCRLHDCGGPYGGGCFVDIPNIFPDFAADENNPDNYNFHYTDEYISAIEKSGCKTYYRLGVTIEWGSKKTTSLVPPDFDKWARICEHIIMHYNEGWANGFHFNIQYWEIWNEPENPGNQNGLCMWGGSKEEFFELYLTASKYLKNRFPSIKIGGYGSCGFYTLTRATAPAVYKNFITFFEDFLKMVKNENCPLDFFSWHIYTGDEQELITHAKFVRDTLNSYGFENTEIHLNEWNVASEGEGFAEKHTMVGASFNAAVLSLMQNTDYVDKAMYYAFQLSSRYNGFMNSNDLSSDLPWYSFVAYGKLYKLGSSVNVENNCPNIYAIAATNSEQSAILLSNYNSDDENICIKLSNPGNKKHVSLKLLDNNSELEEKISFGIDNTLTLSFEIKKNTVVLIEIE